MPLVTGGDAPYANLDLAASAPALEDVAAHVTQLLPYYSSVHRGAGYASQVCTGVLEAARDTVGAFLGARPDDVVVFGRNTTDALNLLARRRARRGRVPGRRAPRQPAAVAVAPRGARPRRRWPPRSRRSPPPCAPGPRRSSR